MSTPKRSLQERVSEKDMQIEKKIQELKQLQEQKKRLESRRKEDERKSRAHRLIEVGAAVESVLGRTIEKDDLPNLLTYLRNQENRGKYFSRAMENTKEEVQESERVSPTQNYAADDVFNDSL